MAFFVDFTYEIPSLFLSFLKLGETKLLQMIDELEMNKSKEVLAVKERLFEK